VELLHRPPEVTVALDRDSYTPGSEVRATIKVTTVNEAHVTAIKAGLVRQDRYEVPAAAYVSDAALLGASAPLSGIDEAWVASVTLIENATLAPGTSRDFTSTWRLPPDAAQPRESALETHWLVRVDIDRPRAPDVHRAAEVRVGLTTL
jgi:hypothetical protein